MLKCSRNVITSRSYIKAVHVVAVVVYTKSQDLDIYASSKWPALLYETLCTCVALK